jgi:hypothetical protein
VEVRQKPDFFVRSIDVRTKLSDVGFSAKPARQMDKRDRFIAELRNDARAKGLSFRVDYRKGKGGHAMVYAATDSPRCRAGKSIPKQHARSESIWG